jgi:glycosyltransferase involved in cell wall biosynthesis
MKILSVLTYYRPHTSGLTIFAERHAKALARRGHEVTILTSQYDKSTPLEEFDEGLRIRRVPVVARISKGVIMPTIGFVAWEEVWKHDVIHLHLPQFDAPGIGLRGRLFRKPVVVTYHSDLLLPPGSFNRFVNAIVDMMNGLTARIVHKIGAYTEDFAKHSRYLSRYLEKVEVILPPVELPSATQKEINAFAKEHNKDKRHPVIGMATRFASEKGVEVLLDALPSVLSTYPNAKVLYAGQWQDVMQEEVYLARLLPRIQQYIKAGQWEFLGVLSQPQMAAFYPALDMLVVPSLNSTETFGLVQIEAMMNGVPCVASNLPGVRQPVEMTGMGQVVAIGDPAGLAKAIKTITSHPEAYRGDPAAIREQFSPDNTAARYEALYRRIQETLL